MNVLDQYKDLATPEIKELYDQKSCLAAGAMFNWEKDFNVACCLRAANFFGLKEFYQVSGSKKTDMRAAVGCQNYLDFHRLTSEEDFFEKIEDKYVPIGIECNTKYPSQSLFNFEFPKNSIFIFGAESNGLTDSVLDKCESILTIPSYGTIRSLNCAAAASTVFAFYRQYHG